MSDACDFAILIEPDDVFEDFDHRGWRHSLYIDADAREVSTWSIIGGGMPFAVFHRRALMIEIPDGVTGRHLAQWCEEHRAEIGALLSLYAGSSWDGNNMVGGWHEDIDGHECVLRDLLHDADLPKVWPAAEWFGDEPPDWDTVERARTDREAVIDEIIETAAGDALLWRDDVGAYLDERIEDLDERRESAIEAGAAAFRDDLAAWGQEGADLGRIARGVAECDWHVDAINEALHDADVPDAIDAERDTYRQTYVEAMRTWQTDRLADNT